ncbi:MAG: MipA/OmpV family protein [Piscinibacter sp.]
MSHSHPRSPAASAPTTRAAGLTTLVIVLCVAASGAAAQEPGPGGPGDGGWSLGIGAVNKQDAYKGMDRETTALPLVRYENEYLKVGGLGLELKLPGLELGNAGRVRFGVVGKLELGGYEADDAPILAGMAERKGGFWAGARAEWENALVDLSAQWTADTSGHSKGQRFSLGLEKKFRLGRQLMVVPYLGAHWLDRKYVGYYYGVRADEAMAGRAAYAGKAGVNAELGVRTMYLLDRHHSMLLDVSVTGLAKGIKDSPLVDRSNTNRVVLGYMYRF